MNASGKTTTSMLPSASSSMKTHIRSPLRVFSGRRPETMPPIEMSSDTGRDGSRRAEAARRAWIGGPGCTAFVGASSPTLDSPLA